MPHDEFEYYSIIICYVYESLCIHHSPDDVLNKFNGYLSSQPSFFWESWQILDAKLKLLQLHNGIWAQSMCPSMYTLEAVRICKDYIARHLSKCYRLQNGAENTFSMWYCSELDVFLILGSYCQSLMELMRWVIEIWCIVINSMVSLLSFLAMPRQGPLGAAIHVMGYLKLNKHFINPILT